jgi:hypothetical protein
MESKDIAISTFPKSLGPQIRAAAIAPNPEKEIESN